MLLTDEEIKTHVMELRISIGKIPGPTKKVSPTGGSRGAGDTTPYVYTIGGYRFGGEKQVPSGAGYRKW